MVAELSGVSKRTIYGLTYLRNPKTGFQGQVDAGGQGTSLGIRLSFSHPLSFVLLPQDGQGIVAGRGAPSRAQEWALV